MNKRERLECAAKGGKPDRVPVSIYQHSTVHERGTERFVKFTLDFHKKYDPDYVKVMYDEMYDAPVNYQFVTDPSIWEMLERFDPHTGGFGRYLDCLRQVRDAVPADTPVIGTMFSPLHIAARMAWGRLVADFRNDGDKVQKGLATITANIVDFIAAARKETGVDGIFIGAFGAEPSWLPRADYERIERPFDAQVMAAIKGMPFSFVHAHGEEGSYFDMFEQYDCNGISWEDRQPAGPSIAGARAKTKKCLIGGVNHVAAVTATPAQVYAEAREAIAATGGAGFILAPGCTFFGGTPAENMLALKRASEDAAKA